MITAKERHSTNHTLLAGCTMYFGSIQNQTTKYKSLPIIPAIQVGVIIIPTQQNESLCYNVYIYMYVYVLY